MIIQYQKFEIEEALANEYEKRFEAAVRCNENQLLVRKFKRSPKLDSPCKFNIMIEWEIHGIQDIPEQKDDFEKFLSMIKPSFSIPEAQFEPVYSSR